MAGTRRASIDVELGVDEALALIEAGFERAKTAPTRFEDGGWTVERAGDRRVIYPAQPFAHLLEPLPADYIEMIFPETLGVQIDAHALAEGGARVSVRLIRRRVGALVGAVVADGTLGILDGLPLVRSILHGIELRLTYRRNRRAAKRRLLRLALEPLIPHERSAERGPFRE